MESCGNCANAYDEGYIAGRADLDLANARVAVLREGLESISEAHSPWSYTEFGVLCSCGAPMDTNERCYVLRDIATLLASPDDAATKLLAVRDAALGYMPFLQEVPGSNEAKWNAAKELRAALATGPGTSEPQSAPGMTTAPCEHCGSPEGSAAHFRDGNWCCALVPYTNPCPKCDGRGFTREYVDGERESDKCGWCHGGGVVPGEPKEAGS